MMKKSDYELVCYNTDGSGLFGVAKNVVFPKDVDDVKNIILGSQNLVPRGLGSNIVGGCVPNNSVVMDMKSMNKINFDYGSRCVHVGPGVTVRELNERLKPIGYEFPIMGEGTIGGMIAMNVPGIYGRYGNIKDWVEEIEFVNGRGELIKFGRSDLAEVCGLEGITGIIISAKLNVIPYVGRSASIFQSDDIEEVFTIIKRLKLEKSVVMIRLYSSYFSKLLGFPEKYHLIVGFNNSHGKIKGEEYNLLIGRIRKDYYSMYASSYQDVEDPKFLIEKVREFILFLDGLGVPYSADFNLGIVFPYFNSVKSRDEVFRMIKRMNGKPGKFGIGLKRKNRVEGLQKKIVRRVKMRHDPFLKMNRGKFIDVDDAKDVEGKESLKVVFKETPEMKMEGLIKEAQMEEVGSVKMEDNFDDVKADKSLVDKTLFNKDEKDEFIDNVKQYKEGGSDVEENSSRASDLENDNIRKEEDKDGDH